MYNQSDVGEFQGRKIVQFVTSLFVLSVIHSLYRQYIRKEYLAIRFLELLNFIMRVRT